MRLYCAPLEGVTDADFRQVHHTMFGGVEKYFIPFLSPTPRMTFSKREKSAFSPTENAGVPVVPQVLTKDAALFNQMAEIFRDCGYTEINLNAGCPSGTVTAKGKGAGLLRDIDGLRALLDGIFERCALPVSVKTRVGWESTEEWPRLLEVYRDYPVTALIVHPRVRTAFYNGHPHEECYAPVIGAGLPLCANGDLFRKEDIARIQRAFPTADVMVGRGLVANPALLRDAPLTKEELRAYHDALYERCREKWPPNAVLGHMNELMFYVGSVFADAAKPRKAMRKAAKLLAYEEAVDRLFSECELREPPVFTLD